MEKFEEAEGRIPHQWGLHANIDKRGISLPSLTIYGEPEKKTLSTKGRHGYPWLPSIEKKIKNRKGCKDLHSHVGYEIRYMGRPCLKNLYERWPPGLSVRNIWFSCITQNLETRRSRNPLLRSLLKSLKKSLVVCPLRAKCVTLDCRAREVHINCLAIHLNDEPSIRSL